MYVGGQGNISQNPIVLVKGRDKSYIVLSQYSKCWKYYSLNVFGALLVKELFLLIAGLVQILINTIINNN